MAAEGYDVVGLELLRGPNGFKGGIEEVEKRIKDCAKRRADAHKVLDVLLRSDEEKTTQDAEDAVFREAMNTMHCKNNSTGTGLTAFTLDGDPLDVKDMTPEQRSEAAKRAARARWKPDA